MFFLNIPIKKSKNLPQEITFVTLLRLKQIVGILYDFDVFKGLDFEFLLHYTVSL